MFFAVPHESPMVAFEKPHDSVDARRTLFEAQRTPMRCVFFFPPALTLGPVSGLAHDDWSNTMFGATTMWHVVHC